MYEMPDREGFDYEEVARIAVRFEVSVLLESRYDEAEQKINERLKIYSQLHGENVDHEVFALILSMRGEVELFKDSFKLSKIWYTKSYDENVDPDGVAGILLDLGELSLKANCMIDAEQSMIVSLEMYQRIHGADVDQVDIARSLNQRGEVELARCVPDEAKMWFRKGLEMYRRLHGDDTDDVNIAGSVLDLVRAALENLS